MILKRLIAPCWSMMLFTLMLPYQIFRVFVPAAKPGRPGSHPISKVFRKALENKKVKRVVGISLMLVLMLSGLMSNIAAANEGLKTDETFITIPDSQVETKTSLNQPVKGMVAQGFHSLHHGLDILAPVGTEIKPVSEGRIVEASFGRIGWGNTVVVEHKLGLRSRYAHMKDINVYEGQIVDKEMALGTVGLTGWTTGPHLHLEIYQYGKAIDPQSVLPAFSL